MDGILRKSVDVMTESIMKSSRGGIDQSRLFLFQEIRAGHESMVVGKKMIMAFGFAAGVSPIKMCTMIRQEFIMDVIEDKINEYLEGRNIKPNAIKIASAYLGSIISKIDSTKMNNLKNVKPYSEMTNVLYEAYLAILDKAEESGSPVRVQAETTILRKMGIDWHIYAKFLPQMINGKIKSAHTSLVLKVDMCPKVKKAISIENFKDVVNRKRGSEDDIAFGSSEYWEKMGRSGMKPSGSWYGRQFALIDYDGVDDDGYLPGDLGI